MRFFVAAWPPDPVLEVLDRLRRPDDAALRWTPRHRWHVTLRFLGDVDESEVPALEGMLAATAAAHATRTVTLGPATRRLGRSVLAVPVAGLDDLGRAVAAATADIGARPEDRPFAGHLTLARARGRGTVAAAVAGQPVEASWTVAELALVCSRLGAGGPRYETLARFPLAASAHFPFPGIPEVGTR